MPAVASGLPVVSGNSLTLPHWAFQGPSRADILLLCHSTLQLHSGEADLDPAGLSPWAVHSESLGSVFQLEIKQMEVLDARLAGKTKQNKPTRVEELLLTSQLAPELPVGGNGTLFGKKYFDKCWGGR